MASFIFISISMHNVLTFTLINNNFELKHVFEFRAMPKDDRGGGKFHAMVISKKWFAHDIKKGDTPSPSCTFLENILPACKKSIPNTTKSRIHEALMRHFKTNQNTYSL